MRYQITFFASALVTLLAPVPAAQAAPELFYARCMAIYTDGQAGGPVPEFMVSLRKGEAKEIYRSGDVSYEVSYRDTLAEKDVLQFTVSENGTKVGAVASLFVGNEFPRRFDLTVGVGLLTCQLR